MNTCTVCKKEPRNPIIADPALVSSNAVLTKILKKLCQSCQEKTQGQLGEQPTQSDINQLYAIVNGLLTSAEVRQIRKKLKLTQKEASLLCGGGPNAFSRYERGESVPLRATSNLLRLLEKYPAESVYLLSLR